jgi:hypothetical protein
MNDSSDIDTLHAQVILLRMRAKTTEELMALLADKNQKNWSKEKREAAQRVLQERTGKLPEQKVVSPQRTTQVKSRQPFDDNEPIGEPFFNLSPYNNFRLGCIIFGAIFMFVISIILITINQIWMLISR